MSEIENEVARPNWRGAVTIKLDTDRELSEDDWELVGRLSSLVEEFDAELAQRRKERQAATAEEAEA